MQIKTSVVETILANLSPIDRLSRKKSLTGDEAVQVSKDAIRAIRSVLTTLRRALPKKAVAKKAAKKSK